MSKCIFCGRDFEPTPSAPHRKYCSIACYDRSKSLKTLNDWIREAEECNLDYGTYRGLIEQGKTFAELKSRADSRHQPAHSHINKHCNY